MYIGDMEKENEKSRLDMCVKGIRLMMAMPVETFALQQKFYQQMPDEMKRAFELGYEIHHTPDDGKYWFTEKKD